MKALIVIDYTNDFVTGKLPCGDPAIAIEKPIVRLVEQFLASGDEVVMAVDLHREEDPYHPETKLFPPHNIEGTEGRRLYGDLHSLYKHHEEEIYWMDKTRYSAFCGTDLDIRFRARGITELHLVGVCTDICVLHTAVDGYNNGYSLHIHEDAVASFNEAGHVWALGHFRHTLGARLWRNGSLQQPE
ncbi:cysteine hydrolase [Paenibacillus sp. J5C_2022]|uniref:cysteine hydrolase family protein n=1 Tax=Paenibacillus sp. J5C2022 TaxID=2977129 RepID=UPI0021D21EC1|nr:isochorismatase family cysteine hydrolase [Paenibacillus sp. J5C2022]MCU6709016.1 cysteine hydrolase [Paenibacillus sp. J5C2022]